ncbi:very short patch repair endonuclease [Novosphingobium kaempferiae]|uniref:very short patch repair endonuclease n=1 Tax=Novosphingobium kaempferiae TaxID=2896849 RepID=UPI001E45AA75|nr:DNA mismatch endonuclease Vsr [Novosphingobium kaempferiae]
MADIVDPKTRSRMMAGIGGRDTKPEIFLRKQLHAAGLRFKLHAADLPGKPDIVLPSRRIAIFVHGCFWHRHSGCHWCSTPTTRPDFWKTKFDGNLVRDERVQSALRASGWRVGVVWECGLRTPYADATVEQVLAWIRSASGDFESAIVRERGV